VTAASASGRTASESGRSHRGAAGAVAGASPRAGASPSKASASGRSPFGSAGGHRTPLGGSPMGGSPAGSYSNLAGRAGSSGSLTEGAAPAGYTGRVGPRVPGGATTTNPGMRCSSFFFCATQKLGIGGLSIGVF